MIKYIQTFFPVYISVCLSEKSFEKELKRLKITDYPNFAMKDACVHRLHNGSHLYLVLCYNPLSTPRKVSKNQVAALIAHEATHITDWVFEDIGEDNTAMETRAYLIQYITNETLDMIDDFKKAKKKK